MCEEKLPTYFINSAKSIVNKDFSDHLDFHNNKHLTKENYLPEYKKTTRIILTSGASCPDTIVDEVLEKLLSFFDVNTSKDDIIKGLE